VAFIFVVLVYLSAPTRCIGKGIGVSYNGPASLVMRYKKDL
jgi:hypothetical protein